MDNLSMNYMSYVLRKKKSIYYVSFYINVDGFEYAIVKKLKKTLIVSPEFAETLVEKLLTEDYKIYDVNITI